jgi:hypothetical protein
LATEGLLDGVFIRWIDAIGLTDAVDGDIDGILLIGLQRPVGEGGAEEVTDGQREALLGCRGLNYDEFEGVLL